MEASLKKQSMRGDIEYIKAGERLFYVRNLDTGKLSIIFYDNKYRQDTLVPEKALAKLNAEIEQMQNGVDDVGIYNTAEEVRRLRIIRNFLQF